MGSHEPGERGKGEKEGYEESKTGLTNLHDGLLVNSNLRQIHPCISFGPRHPRCNGCRIRLQNYPITRIRYVIEPSVWRSEICITTPTTDSDDGVAVKQRCGGITEGH